MKTSKKALSEYEAAVEQLKRRLKQRGIGYRELAQGIGMSESGLKKVFTASDGSFERLVSICRYAGLALQEILQPSTSVQVDFSDEQQKEFVRNPSTFRYFWYLVYERKSRDEIEKRMGLSKAEGFAKLRRLDQLKLIRLLPGDRLRVPAIRAVRWTGSSPFMRKLYQDWAHQVVDHLAKPESDPDEFFLLRYLKLTPSTYRELLESLRTLEIEFVRRSIVEMQTQPERVQNIRWLGGVDQRSFLGEEKK
jgi:transcriptional regulator with XRE-family HTH domain